MVVFQKSCLEQLFFRESVSRIILLKETPQQTSQEFFGISKIRKAEFVRLQFNANFQKYFKFLREFGLGVQFQQLYNLQTVSLQHWLKGNFWKFLEEQLMIILILLMLILILMHLIEFSTELQNAEISPVTLLKIDSTTNDFPKIL